MFILPFFGFLGLGKMDEVLDVTIWLTLIIILFDIYFTCINKRRKNMTREMGTKNPDSTHTSQRRLQEVFSFLSLKRL